MQCFQLTKKMFQKHFFCKFLVFYQRQVGIFCEFSAVIDGVKKNTKIRKKSKFLSKIETFGQKIKFLAKIGILVKNRNCGKASKFRCKKMFLFRKFPS